MAGDAVSVGEAGDRFQSWRSSSGRPSVGQVAVEALATHPLPIEEAQRAMELAWTEDCGAIKVILSFGGLE